MINLIVAKDRRGAIGNDNKLLCNIKDDMKFFKKMTTGNMVVMGRKTYESIGKPLPDRINIVMSKDKSYFIDEDGVVVLNDVESVLKINNVYPSNNIYIIGGEEIYREFLPHASVVYMTNINHTFTEVDAFFPELNYSEWKIEIREEHQKNRDNDYDFSIIKLTRN